MDLAAFIASRITFRSKRNFSRLIVRIAIVGIMLGLSIMILSVAIVKGFKSEIREKVRGFSGDIQVLKYDLNLSFENSPFIISPQTFQKLKAFPEVAHIQAFATKPGIINANDEVEGVVLKGVDSSYNWTYFSRILSEGKPLDFSDSARVSTQVLISQYTANRLKLKVGDDFIMYFVQEPLRKRKFKIQGIYNLGVEDVDKLYVIGDISMIRRLNNWPENQVGGFEIRLKNFDELDQAATKVYDNLDLNLKSYSVKEYYPTIFQWLGLLDINTEVILVLMLAVAVINMISALLIMILERTNMIGLLKAMGATNWKVQQIFLYNAAMLIGWGLLLGNILGVGLALTQHYTQFITLDQASYYMKYVPVQLEWLDILLLNLGTLVICLLVLIIPSFLVTRISPVKAIGFK